MTTSEKAQRLRALHHEKTTLLLPNAWDVASARILEAAGFPAVATSSAGVAASRGYADGGIPPREMLEACAAIARAVRVPVTADLEDGYTATADLGTLVADMVGAGLVGLNLEDIRRDASDLVPLDEQCARIRTIRAAGERAGVPVVINARTDVFLRRIGEASDRERVAVERGNAFLEAGADCVFVPAVTDKAQIGRLVGAIRGPVNVLAVAATPPLGELQALGVRRVSLGSGPARLALAAFRNLCDQVLKDGRFDALGRAIPYDEVNALMSQWQS